MKRQKNGACYPPLLLRWIGRKNWRRTPAVFALSTGRTGTTTLTKLLNLATEVVAYHEPAPTDEYSYRIAYELVESDRDWARRYFERHRAGFIGATNVVRKVYAETNNMQFFAPVVRELLPNSKFLFLHRHPAEYVRSGMRRGWYVGHPWDKYRLRPRPKDPALTQWETWDPFEKICWFWDAANRFFIDFVGETDACRTYTIPAKSVFDVDVPAINGIFQFIDVPSPPENKIRATLAHRHNEQQDGYYPHWREWTKGQRDQLVNIAGETMVYLGYDPSRFVELGEVT